MVPYGIIDHDKIHDGISPFVSILSLDS